jgi:cyanophycin synthetase
MKLSVTPSLIIEAAEKRGWKTQVLDDRFGFYGLNLPDGRAFYLRGISSIKSSTVNTFIADQKSVFAKLAEAIGVPVPPTLEYRDDMQPCLDFLSTHGTIVVKPADSSHGTGVTIDVTTEEEMRDAMEYAGSFSRSVLLQRQIHGDDYRLLMIGGELAAAAIREPAFVHGDGVHTITELIEVENSSGNRVEGYGRLLTHIDPEAAGRYLGGRMGDVPATGEKIRVMGTANIGKGGVSIDVTDTVDTRMVDVAERLVAHFGYGVCGIDFLVDADGNPFVLEINAGPSLGLHEFPYKGEAEVLRTCSWTGWRRLTMVWAEDTLHRYETSPGNEPVPEIRRFLCRHERTFRRRAGV